MYQGMRSILLLIYT